MTILVLYLIHSCTQYWIIVVTADWYPVLVPQTLRHFSKYRTLSISWYHQLHVQMRVVKHIWSEVGISLRYIQVVDDVITLLLKFQVIFEVLRPVFRIWI